MRDQSKRVLNALVFIMALSALTPAPLSGQTPAPAPNAPESGANSGLFPVGGYAINQIESINAVTGTMSLKIPLAKLPPGPAGSLVAVDLVYNSTLFDMTTGPDLGAVVPGQFELANYQVSTHGGGWTYGYQYQLWSQPYASIPVGTSCPSGDNWPYEWFKTYLTTPDGGNHLLLLQGSYYSNGSPGPTFTTVGTNAQDYYLVDFSGNLNHICQTGSSNFQGKLVYITADNSFIRVEVNTVSQIWTAYFADGSQIQGFVVVDGTGAATTSDAHWFLDRNENSVFITMPFCVEGQACSEGIGDSFGQINITYTSDSSGAWSDTLSWPGPNQILTTTVNWETYNFNPNPNTGQPLPFPCGNAPWFLSDYIILCSFPTSLPVVTSVQLPPATGDTLPTGGAQAPTSAIYQFVYNSSATYNWGEIHSLTMYTGASPSNCQPQYGVQYSYYYDSSSAPRQSFGNVVNPLVSRVLKYTETDDAANNGTGAEDPLTETTSISYSAPFNSPSAGGTSVVTHPDGSTTTYYSANICPQAVAVTELCAPLVYKVVAPDGTTAEMAWATNPSPPPNIPSGGFFNPYVQYSAVEVPLPGTQPPATVTTTAATSVDGNGNVTSTGEYGFLAPGQILTRSTANVSSTSVLSSIPGSPIRTTTNGYYSFPAYWDFVSVPRFLHSQEFSSTRNASGAVVAASQYAYDSYFTTANLTFSYQWDSTLGAYPGDPTGCCSPTLSSSNAAVWSWTYLTNGNVTSAKDPDGHVTAITYDSNSLYPVQIVTAQGLPEARTTTYAWNTYPYDGQSLPSGVLEYQYDSDNAVELLYSYDSLGRTTAVQQYINGNVFRQTAMDYDDNNLVVATKQDQAQYNDQQLVTTTYYDALGRVRLTADALGNKVEKAYRFGNNVSYELTSNPYTPGTLSDAAMGWSLTTRDSVGRVTSVAHYATSNPPGTTQQGNLAGQSAPASWGSNTTTTGLISTAYNLQLSGCSGAAVSSTDEAGYIRSYCPDGLGRLIGVTEPNSNVTTYGYDPLDNLTSVSMGNRTFLYSSLSRLMCASNPGSATNSCPTSSTASQIGGLDWYTYDPNGNLSSHTDARGAAAAMTYDGLNRVKTRNYSAGANTAATPNVSFLYDQDTKGTLYSVTTSLGGNIYTHDKLGRVTGSVQTTNGASYGLGYSYSLSDQLAIENYPTGRVVQYGFDTADRVTSVTGPSSKTYVPNITYKPASIPNALALANGLTETYTWNDRLQLTGLNAGNALALGIYPCDQGATSCPTGNTGGTWRETITTNGALNAVQEFRHDSLNRLITASEKPALFTVYPSCPDATSVWCRQFGYDAPGNRTVAGRSPNGSESWDVSSISSATNKIQDAGWSYDAAGNIIGANNTGTSVAMLYDAENRQVTLCAPYAANCANTPGTGVTVYYYDGEGRRVEQVETTGTTVFVYDAFGNLVADYGGSAIPTSGTEYVTVDDVGTTRLITDSQANVLERHDFEPFGHELLGLEGGWRSGVAGYYVSPTSVRQQFTGQERDDTGLDFFQARYFTSAQGRFASVDPGNAGASLGDPQSWNGYAYVSNSPLRFTDPRGLDDGGGGFGGFDIPPIFGGSGGGPSRPKVPSLSTGALDRLNPLLGAFSPCGGPSGTYGGGATGCPFIFSATITTFQTIDVSSTLQALQAASTPVLPSAGNGRAITVPFPLLVVGTVRAATAATWASRLSGIGAVLSLALIQTGGSSQHWILKDDIKQVRQAAQTVAREPGCRAPEPDDFETVHESIKDLKGPNGKVSWNQLLEAWRDALCK